MKGGFIDTDVNIFRDYVCDKIVKVCTIQEFQKNIDKELSDLVKKRFPNNNLSNTDDKIKILLDNYNKLKQDEQMQFKSIRLIKI